MSRRTSFAGDVREHRSVVLAVLGTYVGWIAFGLANGSRSTVAYAVMMPLLVSVAAIAHHRVGFTTPLLWALAA